MVETGAKWPPSFQLSALSVGQSNLMHKCIIIVICYYSPQHFSAHVTSHDSAPFWLPWRELTQRVAGSRPAHTQRQTHSCRRKKKHGTKSCLQEGQRQAAVTHSSLTSHTTSLGRENGSQEHSRNSPRSSKPLQQCFIIQYPADQKSCAIFGTKLCVCTFEWGTKIWR